jgi:hypothetical protein
MSTTLESTAIPGSAVEDVHKKGLSKKQNKKIQTACGAHVRAN